MKADRQQCVVSKVFIWRLATENILLKLMSSFDYAQDDVLEMVGLIIFIIIQAIVNLWRNENRSFH